MYKIVILPLAKEDIRNSALWYNKQQKGLGRKFTKKVREKVNFIAQNNTASMVRYKSVRTTIVDVFPYMIHYKIDEEKKQIVIYAVFAMSQSPIRWKTR